ncbi:MAG: hypothetical protein ACQKBT_05045 [Puniceicoccales bacterium]
MGTGLRLLSQIILVGFCCAQSLSAEDSSSVPEAEPASESTAKDDGATDKTSDASDGSGAKASDSGDEDSSEVDDSAPVATEEPEPVLQGEYEWIDNTHSWIYNESQEVIEWFDGLFVSEDENPIDTPPSRFRLGLFTEFDLDADRDFKLQPVVDFKTDIQLPNLERRLKVFITTRDPTALPDEDPTESNNELRFGATRDFFKNWNTSAGVKARWPPEAFVNAEWVPTYDLGNRWNVYPKVKPFWDSDRGFGGLTSLVVNHWKGRWLFRPTVSLRWDQKDRDEDRESADDPTSSQYGQDGMGYRWSVSTVVGYVPHLLDENDYGRRVGGSDVADGWGLRGRVEGNISQTLSYDLTVFRKAPLYKDFVFYVIAPEVQWEQDNSWEAEYSIQIGVEVLLWGQDTYRGRK